MTREAQATKTAFFTMSFLSSSVNLSRRVKKMGTFPMALTITNRETKEVIKNETPLESIKKGKFLSSIVSVAQLFFGDN